MGGKRLEVAYDGWKEESYAYYYICPECAEKEIIRGFKYCPKCGIKLPDDWEGVE